VALVGELIDTFVDVGDNSVDVGDETDEDGSAMLGCGLRTPTFGNHSPQRRPRMARTPRSATRDAPPSAATDEPAALVIVSVVGARGLDVAQVYVVAEYGAQELVSAAQAPSSVWAAHFAFPFVDVSAVKLYVFSKAQYGADVLLGVAQVASTALRPTKDEASRRACDEAWFSVELCPTEDRGRLKHAAAATARPLEQFVGDVLGGVGGVFQGKSPSGKATQVRVETTQRPGVRVTLRCARVDAMDALCAANLSPQELLRRLHGAPDGLAEEWPPEDAPEDSADAPEDEVAAKDAQAATRFELELEAISSNVSALQCAVLASDERCADAESRVAERDEEVAALEKALAAATVDSRDPAVAELEQALAAALATVAADSRNRAVAAIASESQDTAVAVLRQELAAAEATVATDTRNRAVAKIAAESQDTAVAALREALGLAEATVASDARNRIIAARAAETQDVSVAALRLALATAEAAAEATPRRLFSKMAFFFGALAALLLLHPAFGSDAFSNDAPRLALLLHPAFANDFAADAPRLAH